MKRFILLILLLFCFSVQIVFAAERPRWVAQPIYVYVPECGKYSNLMKKAFLAWEEKSDDLVRFKFVSKPSNANIVVKFVKNVQNCGNEYAVGCARMTTRNGKYYKGQLDIALKHKDASNAYRPINNIYGVMLHEIGHALGLEHSKNPYSIMYSIDLPTMQYLTKDDMRLLYKKYH